MRVKYAYLDEQYADVDEYFDDLRTLVSTGEFTLGPFVDKFERKFADYLGVKHAIGTNSGTDALIVSLKAVGVKSGDEVITCPNTFIATVGAIVAAGGTPVFVDSDERYQIDVSKIEAAITPKTKAIVPVHWGGCPSDVEEVMRIAERHGLSVVEDACPSAGARINGRSVGTFGHANAFSMHPLKPLNVWGDGGVIVTNDDKIAEFVRLYHNHGLSDRDHVEFWGVNTRLQPVQAVVATRQLDVVDAACEARIRLAQQLDAGLRELEEFVSIPARPQGYREIYQLYQVGVKDRDGLMAQLIAREIEVKVHYPIPLHLQKAASELGYKKGDFPVCERQAGEVMTIPAHQFINEEQIDFVLSEIKAYYAG